MTVKVKQRVRHPWYRQCQLRRRYLGKEEVTTTYLPDKGDLRVGNRARFRARASEPWSESWVIMAMGRRQRGELVEAAERDYLRHREATDI